MEIRKLVFMDSKSSKFWNIELDGESHTVTYGRTGTNGQTKTKEFDSAEKAKKDFDKLVQSKMKKGYVDAGDDGGDADSDELPFIAFGSVHKHDDIYDNVGTFIGKRVVDYDRSKGPASGGRVIYRFRSDWEEEKLKPDLEHFLASDAAAEATGIVIGSWGGEDSMAPADETLKLLASGKDRLTSLIAIYFGDITQEENEMSWIVQTDLSPLLESFPNLQVLRTRGGESLAISRPKNETLRALALETGGMPVEVIRSISTADFPNLEYLELWLGTSEYGGTSSVQDLQPILSGELFPKLKYLGLRNCEYVDDIAAVVVNSPVIDQIETLDLSLGVLTDEGAQALLALPDAGPLQKVSLHYNYITAGVNKKLKAHKLDFDTSKPDDMDDDDEWRFVAVGE